MFFIDFYLLMLPDCLVFITGFSWHEGAMGAMVLCTIFHGSSVPWVPWFFYRFYLFMLPECFAFITGLSWQEGAMGAIVLCSNFSWQQCAWGAMVFWIEFIS